MKDAPRISIIIETLNYDRGNERLLQQVLDSLQQQTLPAQAIEIILVVDPDKEPDLGRRLQSKLPPLRVIEAPGLPGSASDWPWPVAVRRERSTRSARCAPSRRRWREST